MREIKINPVLNGWIVKVGCQTLAYSDRSKLIADMVDYLYDPVATEARIMATEAINKRFTLGPISAPIQFDTQPIPSCGTGSAGSFGLTDSQCESNPQCNPVERHIR